MYGVLDLRYLIDWQYFAFCGYFVLLGKNVAFLPALENFQIRQTMCNMLLMYPKILRV